MATVQNAPSFVNIDLLPPVLYEKGKEPEEYLLKLNQHLLNISEWSQQLDLSIRNGYFVSNSRVISLDAEKITSETIFTQDLFIGDEQNIRLLGTSNTIDVYDNQTSPQLRVRKGKLGSGNDNWGEVWYDASGNEVMRVGSVVALDGVIITNGSINASQKIQAGTVTATEMNVTQLSAITANLGTITAGSITTTASVDGGAIDTGTLNANLVNVINLNADNISTGTLTADGNPAIHISGSGALLLSNGGDAIFRSSNTNDSVVKFQSSSGSQVGIIRMLGSASSPTGFGLIATGTGDDVYLQSNSGEVVLNGSSGIKINAPLTTNNSQIQFVSDIESSADNVHECGSAFNAWSDVNSYAFTTQTGVEFGNQSFITEPYHVWSEQVMAANGIEWDEGLVIVTNDNTPRALIGKNGIRTNLPPSDIDDPAVKKWKERPEMYEFQNGKYTRKLKNVNGTVTDTNTGKKLSASEIEKLKRKWEQRANKLQ